MDVASAHEFFAASAGVAGALIGLLFVAISVAGDRVLGPEAREAHAVRAAATLTAFTNALTVAMFGLIPGMSPAVPATVVAIGGLLFVLAALVRLIPSIRAGRVQAREASFLASLLIVFAIQLVAGLDLDAHSHSSPSLRALCILIVVCFLIGIERAWELVGGPHVGLISSILQRDEPPEDG